MEQSLVSVIIPVHNGAQWLPECLESVFNQTYRPLEIIVVDDGSTDDTAAVLHAYEPGIRVLHQKQGGIGSARNHGIRAASGTYLAFLDCDDLWLPQKLRKQVAKAESLPDLDVTYTDAEEFDIRGTIHSSFFDLFPGLRQPADLFCQIMHLAVPLPSTVLVRKALLEKLHVRFTEENLGVEDVGFYLEIMAKGGRFGFLDEPLLLRRLHGQNLSKDHYNRFHKRIVLYLNLLNRLPFANSEQRQLLRWGLRHAHWCVGEWHWGRLELDEAREHFAQALGTDGVGRRALLYGMAACLPATLANALRQAKHILQRQLL
jgi:glycosyltransferase involved in cell wall biosynthesis